MTTASEGSAPNTTPTAAAEEETAQPATSLPRIAAAIVMSYFSFMIGLMVPLQLVLTLHLTRLADGGDATGAFGIVTGFGALVGLIANVIGGRLSDRTTWRLGRRRSWILIGAGVGALALVAISLTTEVWQVAIVWCCITSLFNFQLAATSALLADQVPQKRQGTVSGLIGLASALGPLAGLSLVNTVQAGSPSQWHLVAIATFVLAIVAAALIRE
ncbi:MAG: MFS transporter, partial [Propionibacteriaceae bacterium]|nr:MFS transporter [Propionibacteriaceae bacterium]